MSKPIANPYVGPRAFEEGEGARFFGRDRELAKLLNLLIARRLVLLHAPSGAGKTSLIQAALIPRLRDEGFVVRRSIRVHAEVPPEVVTLGPNRYLLSTLTALDEEVPPAQRSAPADLAQISLTRYLDQRRSDGDVDEVLIFDQFEEVLTADTTDRAAKDAFLAELGAALEDPHRWALFAIREDYLGQLRPLLVALPTRLDTLFRLDLLDPAHARRAVQEPAHTVGGNFRDEAAAKLIDDLRQTSVQRPDGSSEVVLGQSIEPMHLQVVCYRLWERKTGDRRQEAGGRQEAEGEGSITVEDLAEAGDVDTALRDYYAEQVAATAHASGVDERRIRDWVEENLITESGLRGQVLRAPDATGGLANTVIRRLVDAHLVRAEERRGVTWYELAHDRLIAPVRQDNAVWFEANLSTLQHQARLWERAGKPEGLLLRGKELQQAEVGLREPELSESEQAFLAACRVARSVEERERRQSRRIRLLAWISSFGGVIALVLAGIAWSFYGKANTALGSAEQSANQARTAEVNAVDQAHVAQTSQAQAVTAQADAEFELRRSNTQQLAFAAQAQIGDNAEVGLLLAYEAIARDDNLVTEQTLRDGIKAVPWRQILLSGHTNRLTSAVFSPDGTRIVTASYDNLARLWDATGRPIAILKGHTDIVNSAVFSPDGTHILTASEDGTARLWDAQGQPIAILKGHTEKVNSAMFSPDGSHILTVSWDTTARLWNAQGRPLATLTGHTAYVTSGVFSPDGSRILTTSGDMTARLWDVQGRPLATLTGHTAPVWNAVFSPDGRRILTASWDNTARLWDAQGQPLTLLSGHTGRVNSAIFSRDGTRILTASNDGTARLWDTQGQFLTLLFGHTDIVNSAVFSPDGTHILTASWDNTARLWDVQGRTLDILSSHTAWVGSAVFSPDGSHILTASRDMTVRLWNMVGQPLATIKGHTDYVTSALFNPDGQHILTASRDMTARLWNTAGQLLATFQDTSAGISINLGNPHTCMLSAVFSPDGTRILTASGNGTTRLWDKRGQLLATLSRDMICGAVFSPDGKRILTPSDRIFDDDNTARLWDVTGHPLAILSGHTGAVNSAVFSPDGSRILTASRDGTARLWDASGTPLITLSGHTGWVNSAVFSPDGNYVLTASDDGTARLWDVAGQLLAILNGHAQRVNSAVFSPDGNYVLTASDDGTVRLWDAAGKLLATLKDHTAPVRSAVFSPDGTRILTASDDMTAQQYLVRSEDLRRAAACRVGRELTQEEIDRFQVPTPLAFDFEKRQCPPVYSWQQGTK